MNSPRIRRNRVLITSLCCLLGFAACDGTKAPEASGAIRELMHSVAGESPDDVEFTTIRDLLVDAEGRIYVLDGPATIPVLSPTGELIQTIGRQGAGPGEFRGISSAYLGRDDSLFVYDIELSRLTAFGPERDQAAALTYLREEYPFYAASVLPAATGGLYARYTRVYADDAGRDERSPARDLVRHLGPDGALLQDSVLSLREQQFLEVSHGTSTSVYRNPFGRRTVLRTGSDGRLVVAWTDSARFDVYSPEGAILRSIEAHAPPPPRPVTSFELDSLVDAYSPDGQDAPAIRRVLDRLNYRTWPLVHDFILDDRDRIWYAPVPPRDATSNTWMALDEQGNTVERLTLPINATPHVIRGTRAYVSETDSLDVPRVVIYDLQPAPPSRNR